jgi:hypothetical protein
VRIRRCFSWLWVVCEIQDTRLTYLCMFRLPDINCKNGPNLDTVDLLVCLHMILQKFQPLCQHMQIPVSYSVHITTLNRTECFVSCGHYCRTWFARSLWRKIFLSTWLLLSMVIAQPMFLNSCKHTLVKHPTEFTVPFVTFKNLWFCPWEVGDVSASPAYL